MCLVKKTSDDMRPLASGVGVVLDMVSSVGCPWWGSFVVTFYVTIFRVQGAPPPLCVGAISWFLMHWHWLC